ncbi:MAG: nitroreductase family deazaflavin-dependent oxidoreductase [Acidimicrobiia bacterium]
MAQTRLERQGPPTGLKRLLFRAPIPLYRARLGFILGKRFLMLEHTGRKSGETRRTILEVVVDDPDAAYVAAAWGDKAQWLQNVKADPRVTFHLGSHRYNTEAEVVEPERAHELMERYASLHPKVLDRLASYMLDDPGDSPQEQATRLAERIPVVRLGKGSGPI